MSTASYTELAGLVAAGRRDPARQADARAGPVGRAVVRDVRPRHHAADRRRRSRTWRSGNAEKYAEWAVRETGFGVVADKVVKNRLCSRGIADAYRDHDFVTPRIDADRRDRRGAASGRRGARADAEHEPRVDGLLQGAARAHDPQRGRGEPAPARQGVLRRRGPGAGRGCRRRRGAGRRGPGRRGAVGPPGRGAHGRRAHRRHPGDRWRRDGARRLLLRQPGHRRRSRQRPGAGRRLGRPRQGGRSGWCAARPSTTRCCAPTRACSWSRRPSRTGSSGRCRATARTCSTTPTGTRCATPSSRRVASTPRWSGESATDIAARAGVRVAAPDEDPGRAVRPRRRRGAAGPREALPGARASPACPRSSAASAPPPRCSASAARATPPSCTAPTPRSSWQYAAAVDVLRVTVNAGGSTGSAGFDTDLAPSMTIGTGFTGRVEPRREPRAEAPAQPGADRLQQRRPRGLPGLPRHRPVGRPATGHTAVPPWRATTGLGRAGAACRWAHGLTAATGQEPSELREELRRLIIEELNAIVRG